MIQSELAVETNKILLDFIASWTRLPNNFVLSELGNFFFFLPAWNKLFLLVLLSILMISTFIVFNTCFRIISLNMSRDNWVLMNRADDWFHTTRQSAQSSAHQWLNHDNNINLVEKFINDELIVGLIGQDHTSFQQWVSNAAEIYNGQLPVRIPDLTDEDIWPAGAPILDHLASLSRYPDSWPHLSTEKLALLQNSRGLSEATLNNIETREVVIGQSPAEDFEEADIWIQKKLDELRDTYHVPWVPALVLSMRGYLSVAAEILSEPRYNHVDLVRKKVQLWGKFEHRTSFPEDRRDYKINIPLALVIGDGKTFSLIVRFPTRSIGKRARFLRPRKSVEPAIKLVENLPHLLVGDQLAELGLFERFLDRFRTDKYETQLGPLKIQCLARLAGLSPLSASASDAVTYIATGAPTCELFLTDESWVKSWSSVSDAARTCVLAHCRILFCSSVAYFGALTYEVMPSVDVAFQMANRDLHSLIISFS